MALSAATPQSLPAVLNDPLTAAVLAPNEIRAMVNQMFAQNKDYLPQFTHFTVG
jgi:alpha-galactosidase